MKALTDCSKCRKQIAEQAKNEFIKKEYAIFQDCAYTMAVYATVAALTVQVRRGRSKEYIQKLFDDMVCVYNTPTMFGKPINLNDLMHTLETEYGLDFQRINVRLEDEKEFAKSIKERK